MFKLSAKIYYVVIVGTIATPLWSYIIKLAHLLQKAKSNDFFFQVVLLLGTILEHISLNTVISIYTKNNAILQR